MHRLQSWLTLKQTPPTVSCLLVVVFLAFAFSFVIRLIWVYQFDGAGQFYWNNQIMINTNDGYYFAEGARDILASHHEANDLSPVNQPLSRLTAFLATIVPFSFETLILYMPTFFGSLLVVPTVLVGYTLKQPGIGLVAGAMAGIVWSYYNRTMTGYFDSDLLVVVFPAFYTIGAIWAIRTKRYWLLLLAPLIYLVGEEWHNASKHVGHGVFYFLIGYLLLFERQERYGYKLLIMLAIVLTSLAPWLKLSLLVVLTIGFYYFQHRMNDRILFTLAALVAMLFFVFDGFAWLSGILRNTYIIRAVVADEVNLTLKYFGVVNTVREAGQIPFEIFANRISGHMVTFFLSAIGYVLMCVRYPVMLLALPMVALGLFAVQGGLRFTVFAVPWMALGLAYFIFLLGKFLPLWPRITWIVFASAAALYPNIVHIQGYKVPTVFNREEVEVLNQLKNMAQREDYVDTWWDYGYPIRYYSDVKTLVDGGKHDGGSNYPVSFALTYPNIVSAAKISRLDVEMTEKNFQEHCGFSIECMLKHYGEVDPSKFLKALESSNFSLPKKTRDVYFYLPLRMMEIFPTVKLFSNLDLVTGKQNPRPLFYYTTQFQEQNGKIQLGGGIEIIKEGGKINLGGSEYPLKQFIVTAVEQSGRVQKQVQQLNPASPITVIFMQSYNAFLVLDDNMLNSLYIQLFVLDNYPKELFEPVILSPLVKVFKLKI